MKKLFSNFLFFILLIIFSSANRISSQPQKEFTVDKNTLFLIHFENSLIADYSSGKKEPEGGKGTISNEGLFGKSLLAKENFISALCYKTEKNLNFEIGTIELWYRPDFSQDKKGQLTIYRLFWSGDVKKDKGISLVVNNDGNTGNKYIGFVMGNPEENIRNYGIYEKVDMKEGNWYHIAATWDNKRMMVFLNGKLVGSKELKTKIPFGETFWIGNAPYLHLADGLIDEFRISDIVRYIPDEEKNFSPDITLWKIEPKEGAMGEWKFIEGKFLMLDKKNEKGWFSINPPSFISISSGQKYRFSVDFHVENKTFGTRCYLAVHQFDKNGKEIGFNISPYSGQLHPLSKKEEWSKLSITFTTFQNTENVLLRVISTGNPSTILFKNPTLKIYNPQDDKRPYTFIPPQLPYTWEDVVKKLANKKDLTAEIKNINRKPYLFIDNQLFPPIFYNGPYWTFKNAFNKDFGESNVNLQIVHIPLGPYDKWHGKNSSIWKGHKQYDFSLAEENIRHVLCGNPSANIIIGIAVWPYRTWGEKYQDEVVQDQFGKKGIGSGCHLYKFGDSLEKENDFWCFSYYSEVFRNEVSEVISALIDYLKKQPYWKSIVGFLITGGDDGQWLDWALRAYDGKRHLSDYSPAALKAFRKYLKNKYGSDENLQKLTGDKTLKIDIVQIPSPEERLRDSMFRDPKKDLLVIEYENFLSWGVADLINYLGKLVKEKADKKIITLTYYADLSIAPCSNHFGLRNILSKNYIDFLACPVEYNPFRQPGMPSRYGGSFSSLNLHNKIWLNELDFRTWKTFYEGYETSKIYLAYAETPEEFNSINRRDTGSMIAIGNGFWYYDMSGGWFSDSLIMNEIKQTYSVYSKLISKKTEFKPDIAVVLNENSIFYHSDRENHAETRHLSTGRQLPSLYLSGVPFDIYEIEDIISGKVPDYKVYIFLNSYYLSTKQREFINKNLKKGNKTLVWMYGTGYIDENGFSVEKMKNLTGINIKTVLEKVSLLSEPVLEKNQYTERLELLLTTFDGGYSFNQKFYVEDTEVIPVGRYVEGKEISIAVKKFPNWTSIFVGSPGALTPQLIFNIAKNSNSFIISEPGDVIWLNDNFLSIHGCTKEIQKTINLPKRYKKIIDAFSNEIIAENTDILRVKVPLKETRWFLLEK